MYHLIRPRIENGGIVHEVYSRHAKLASAIRAGKRGTSECKRIGIGSVHYVVETLTGRKIALSGALISERDFAALLDAVHYERKQLTRG